MLVDRLAVTLDPTNQNNVVRIGYIYASQQCIVPGIVIDNRSPVDGNVVAKVIPQKRGMQPIEGFNLGA